MKQRRRIYYSESQKALMWERWRKGESLQHIAQLFNRNHSSVQGILAQTGGIQPAPPPAIAAGAHACRARGDFARSRRGRFDSGNRPATVAITVHDLSRDQA
jgi:hypothetical protein